MKVFAAVSILCYRMEYSDGSGEAVWFGRVPYMRPDWGWQEVGADIIVDPGKGTKVICHFDMGCF